MSLFVRFFFIVIFFSLFSCKEKNTISAIENFQYFPYKDSEITLEKAIQLQKDDRFKKNVSNLNLGFSYSKAWIYFKIPDKSQKHVIYIENALLDEVTFYTFRNNKLLTTFQSGDKNLFNKRTFTNNFINYQIQEQTEHVFIEIKTEGPLIAPTSLKTIEEYTNYIQEYNFILGLYFGFILLILTSNLMIYLWLREKLNLFYAGFLLASGIITLADLGLFFQFVWPSHPSLNNTLTLYIYLLGFYILFFSEKLINLKKHSTWLYKSYKILYLLILLMAIIITFTPYNTAIRIIISFTSLLPFIILLSSIIVYNKHKTIHFRLFIIGWIIYMIAVSIYIITNFGLLPYNLFTSLSVQIGTAIQILFINLAILSKIHTLTIEKETILSEQNKVLEERVHKRTNELQQKNEIIEKNNKLLQNQQEHLENLVEKRTHELVEKNKSLQESEERFRFLAESVPVLIWTGDPNGNLDFINKRWKEYTGIKLNKISSQELFSSIHPSEHEDVLKKWEHSIKEGIEYEQKYRLKRLSDGIYRWHIGRALPLKDKNDNIIKWVGTSVDINEEKEIQESLTETNKELIKLNKDLDDFIYTASHDLRVPLANIQGLSNALSDLLAKYELEDSKEMSLIVKMINQSLKKQESVIMDLTEIGKIQRMRELNTEEIFIETIIDNSLNKFETLIKKSNAKFNIDISECKPFQFSPSNCQTILDTLIKNSLIYKSPDRDPVIDISCITTDNYVIIEVKDNGLGIKEEYKSKIFGLFKRLYTHVEGSGLGLYMVKQIIDNSGGKIKFESEYQKWTQFKVSFPIGN